MPTAYESSQARGQIGAVAAGLQVKRSFIQKIITKKKKPTSGILSMWYKGRLAAGMNPAPDPGARFSVLGALWSVT